MLPEKNVSTERNHYLREIKKRKIRIHLIRILIIAVFLILWEITASCGIIDSFFFASPSRLVQCFIFLTKENAFFSHISITLLETAVSFLLVTLLSLLCAILLWYFKTAANATEPYLVILNSLPKSALAPLLIVWFGGNMKTIIITGLSVAIFGSVLSLYRGFQEVEPDKYKLIATLGGNKKDVLFKIILPSNIPNLLTIMKVNIGLCLVGVIIGEFIAARKGLGYLIIYGSQVFKMDWVILSILVLCVIAFALYQIITVVEKKFSKAA
ncbi:MAG: ABC transporter permease [Eubacterium sp.]|nr:ABC transporter permease [Eubacterium sp.]